MKVKQGMAYAYDVNNGQVGGACVHTAEANSFSWNFYADG